MKLKAADEPRHAEMFKNQINVANRQIILCVYFCEKQFAPAVPRGRVIRTFDARDKFAHTTTIIES